MTSTAPRQYRRSFWWLICGVSLSVLVIAVWGAMLVRQSRHNAQLLADRRAEEAANLFANALRRDMEAVQRSVLLSADWDRFTLEPPYDVITVVAGAFARYPYPQYFFGWTTSAPPTVPVFFTRRDRPPGWLQMDSGPNRYPVVLLYDAPVAQDILARLRADAGQRRQFSIFEASLGGSRTQVVARLLYSDAFKAQLVAAFGFAVDLQWARDYYFPQIAAEAEQIESANGVRFSVVDGEQHAVAGSDQGRFGNARAERRFPMMFFSPSLLPISSVDHVAPQLWLARATLNDSALPSWLGSVAAATMFILGLGMAVGAVHARVSLAELRSEFAASVTHELKTPIATIRAIGETMATGRPNSEDSRREYAQIVVQEAKRLTRLVENLLALTRVSDVAVVQQFEPVELADLIEDAVQRIEWQLREADFQLSVDVPRRLPPVRADRTALTFMLDNVLDNALRHSRRGRQIEIRASEVGRSIRLEVSDAGGGIPQDELPLVKRKFFRGRDAAPGGTGLGLAIADRIATDHGGALTISSIPAVGTTVSIRLPIAAA